MYKAFFAKQRLLKLVICLAATSSAYANPSFPERAITLVVPYGAGGSTDTVSRKVAAKLSELVKVPVVVENKPGASTTIGASFVARSAPDGYTMLIADSSTFAYNKHIYKNLNYDFDRDISPVTTVSAGSMVLASSVKSNIKSLDDLLAMRENNLPELNYASAGIGTPPHVMMESFLNKTKIKAKHIPYRGELPGLTDMMGGTIDIMFLGPRAAKELSAIGKINILGWGGKKRNEIFPGLPAIGEKIKGYEENVYQGIFVPSGTPEPVVNKLKTSFDAVYRDADIQNWLSSQSVGISYKTSTPTELANIIKAEQKKAGETIKNISLE